MTKEALKNNETAVCSLLDIDGAFGQTSHQAIQHALEGRGVDSPITGWIGASTRVAEASTGSDIIKVRPVIGYKQGGVLSPFCGACW